MGVGLPEDLIEAIVRQRIRKFIHLYLIKILPGIARVRQEMLNERYK